MKINLHACDKDSSAGYSKTILFENKEDFLEQYNEFKEEVPFSRWYLDLDTDEDGTEELVDSWLE